MPPEEVLFRRQGAPERYEENDIYWADRFLTKDQRLPESDLLKAVHAYASDFYTRATKNKGAVDFESLDETALLGLGILLEEMAGHVLGDTGDLAFVEGEEISQRKSVDERTSSNAANSTATAAMAKGYSGAASESEQKRSRKKRKIRHDRSDDG